MRNYRMKRLSTVNGNYVNVRVYKSAKDMRKAYLNHNPNATEEHANQVLGAHCAYEKLNYKDPENPNYAALMNDTGIVFLSMDNKHYWIVAHEFLHAILWSFKHKFHKKMHPLTIDNMEEEEDICYALTDMLIEFHKWLPKIKF